MAQVRRIRKGRKQNREESYFDYTLLFVVLFLVVFGMLMIYSTSSYEANVELQDPMYYLKKQAMSAGIGLVVMGIVSRISYQKFQKLDMIAFVGSFILVCLVVTPLGITRNGATRWLDLKVIPLTVQPAEIAKLGIIIYSASIITKMGKLINKTKGLLLVIVPAFALAGVIYVLTNNMSSAIIVIGIVVLMIFVATPNYKEYVLLALAGIAGIGLIIMIAVNADPSSGSFRLTRIRAWLDPDSYSTDKAFQTLQALYAIGSGGIWGKGLGQSMQKLGFIPEAQNDMIFSIICEELGLFGAMAIIILFIILIWRCMIIANNAEDMFGALLVVGVMGHFAIQVILNIAVVTNTIPNTGISLPFISYGGSSVLFLLIEIGIVFSVGRGIKLKNI